MSNLDRSGSSSTKIEIKARVALILIPVIVSGALAFQNCAMNRFEVLTGSLTTETTPMPADHIAPAEPPTAKLRLGDRDYVASVLRNVFGSDAVIETVLKEEILNLPEIFGGPCDPYTQANLNPEASVLGTWSCPTGLPGAEAQAYGSPSVIRQARRLRACDRLIGYGPALGMAMAGIHQSQPVAAPRAETIRVAYSYFNPTRALADGAVLALMQLGRSESDVSRSWARVLTVLCHDPMWEIP